MEKKAPEDDKVKEAAKRKETERERRRIAERRRQSDIDDQIQKLMGFIPPSPVVRKISRNEVLRMVYETALKYKKEDAAAEAAAGQSTSAAGDTAGPSTEEGRDVDVDEDGKPGEREKKLKLDPSGEGPSSSGSSSQ